MNYEAFFIDNENDIDRLYGVELSEVIVPVEGDNDFIENEAIN